MSENKKEIATVEEALEDIRAGKIIVVIDDPDRENEGDLICAAEFATQENVNFMACYAKGLICMPMSHDNIIRLGLTQMVSHNTDNHETAFTVSIDHIDTTTGISAVERGLTARMAADPAAHPGDFRRPGHMFPLEAKPGGVLERNGHTEATVDLLRLKKWHGQNCPQSTDTSRCSDSATPSTATSMWHWSWAMWQMASRYCAGYTRSA